MKTTNPKLTVASIITLILSIWEYMQPMVDVVLGMGTKGLAIASFVVTVLSMIYNFIYPNESLLKTAANRFNIIK